MTLRAPQHHRLTGHRLALLLLSARCRAAAVSGQGSGYNLGQLAWDARDHAIHSDYFGITGNNPLAHQVMARFARRALREGIAPTW
jgi:hypothetical protein